MEFIPREIELYETEGGRCPFEEWINGLQDISGRAIIRKRLNRVRLGNIGTSRSLGDGVRELKIDFGPGYRIYYGEEWPKLVILLIGGDKKINQKT